MRSLSAILLVDDELDFINACCDCFTPYYSCKILIAINRQQAEEMISTKPDLVILGTLKPAGEAFALQKWIKQNFLYKHTPVIVIDAEHYDRRWKGWRQLEGLSMESEEYVSKPIEPTALLPVIERVLARPAQLVRV